MLGLGHGASGGTNAGVGTAAGVLLVAGIWLRDRITLTAGVRSDGVDFWRGSGIYCSRTIDSDKPPGSH